VSGAGPGRRLQRLFEAAGATAGWLADPDAERRGGASADPGPVGLPDLGPSSRVAARRPEPAVRRPIAGRHGPGLWPAARGSRVGHAARGLLRAAGTAPPRGTRARAAVRGAPPADADVGLAGRPAVRRQRLHPAVAP